MAAGLVLALLLAACSSSSGSGSSTSGSTAASGKDGGVHPDRIDLTLSGAVKAKIRVGDPNDNIDQDVACYPPDTETKSLNCEFGGLYDGGVADASIALDGYHGPGTYRIGEGLDVSLVQSDIVCVGNSGTVKVDELPAQGTSDELNARLVFDANLDCTTPGASETARLTGSIESHPCLVGGIDQPDAGTAVVTTTSTSFLLKNPCTN